MSGWQKPERPPEVATARVLIVRHTKGSGAAGDRCRQVVTYYIEGREPGSWEPLCEKDSGPE